MENEIQLTQDPKPILDEISAVEGCRAQYAAPSYVMASGAMLQDASPYAAMTSQSSPLTTPYR
jgi:hypothetical protein